MVFYDWVSREVVYVLCLCDSSNINIAGGMYQDEGLENIPKILLWGDDIRNLWD